MRPTWVTPTEAIVGDVLTDEQIEAMFPAHCTCGTPADHEGKDCPVHDQPSRCRLCNGAGGRYVPHPHADGRYVDTWQSCSCAALSVSDPGGEK